MSATTFYPLPHGESFSVKLFIDDMGSYATRARDWEDLLWHVNSARDHDGLRRFTLEELQDELQGSHNFTVTK